MADIEHWVRTARDGTIIRRATLTALLVGTILTAVNHGTEFLRAGIAPGHILPIAFTYLVPFVVSLASSVSATRARERRRDPGGVGAARGLRDRPPYPAASASIAGPDEEIEQRELPP
jgi:hypothetical protein